MNFIDTLHQCSALTGGIATGKSVVAKMLHELGAHIVDTDLIARKVVLPGMQALGAIVEEFGTSVLSSDGTLNREAMRGKIINDPEKRLRLNEITHPEINKIMLQEIDEHIKKYDSMPIIIDVPLLFEVGWHGFFSTVILVYVPVAVQIERLMKRDSIDLRTAEITIQSQMNIEEKKIKATYLIDNTGSIDSTKSQVASVFSSLYNRVVIR